MISFTAPKLKDLLTLCLIYPFVIRTFYLIRQSFEPFYMNATCLLDLVRLSAPEHWDAHPLWKHYNYKETCEEITGYINIYSYINIYIYITIILYNYIYDRCIYGTVLSKHV